MDIEMINPWTQAGSYHGHFERSQTIKKSKTNKICMVNYKFREVRFMAAINSINIEKT